MIPHAWQCVTQKKIFCFFISFCLRSGRFRVVVQEHKWTFDLLCAKITLTDRKESAKRTHTKVDWKYTKVDLKKF